MSVKPAIIFLLFALSAFGQPNPINRRAMAIAGLATTANTTNLTGVAYRWVSSDAATNSKLSTWTDRIRGTNFMQGNTSFQPTNTANQGILIMQQVGYFTNFLLQEISTNMGIGFIWNVLNGRPNGFGGNNAVIWATRMGNSACALTQFGLYFGSNLGTPGALDFFCNGTMIPAAGLQNYTNHLNDFVYYQQSYSSTAMGMIGITNGVLSASNTLTITLTGQAFYGRQDQTEKSGKFLGLAEETGAIPTMRLLEIWIWTNTPSAQSIADFHKYGTNTYGYSP